MLGLPLTDQKGDAGTGPAKHIKRTFPRTCCGVSIFKDGTGHIFCHLPPLIRQLVGFRSTINFTNELLRHTLLQRLPSPLLTW